MLEHQVEAATRGRAAAMRTRSRLGDALDAIADLRRRMSGPSKEDRQRLVASLFGPRSIRLDEDGRICAKFRVGLSRRGVRITESETSLELRLVA
jgi:hypothetical protein